MCRRAVLVQLSKPRHTSPQVRPEVFMCLINFHLKTQCLLAKPVFVWRHMPGHTSREILIILSSLTTCDPANIYELIKVKSQAWSLHPYLSTYTFIRHFIWTQCNALNHTPYCQTLKSLKVRVSVIGLSAEVRVCTVLTRETAGSYHVILDESHYKELLMLHVKPPPASSSSECSLIRMGQYADMLFWCSSTNIRVTSEWTELWKTALEHTEWDCKRCNKSAYNRINNRKPTFKWHEIIGVTIKPPFHEYMTDVSLYDFYTVPFFVF